MPGKRHRPTVKRHRTTDGLIVRDHVYVQFGVARPAAEDLAALAEAAKPTFRLDKCEQLARDVLQAAGLPHAGYDLNLRAAVAGRPHTREWFAAEILRHIAGVRTAQQLGHVEMVINAAISLGECRMLAEIKLGLEADVLLGREERHARAERPKKMRALGLLGNKARAGQVAPHNQWLIDEATKLRQEHPDWTFNKLAEILVRKDSAHHVDDERPKAVGRVRSFLTRHFGVRPLST